MTRVGNETKNKLVWPNECTLASLEGAKLHDESKKEYGDIHIELATFQTTFLQNMLKNEEAWEMVLTKEHMEGCPSDLVSAARQAALE